MTAARELWCDDNPPLVLVDAVDNNAMMQQLAQLLHEYILQRKGVVVMRNLNHDPLLRQLWETCCDAMPAGQSYTNEQIGILVANPKLPRQDFSLWL